MKRIATLLAVCVFGLLSVVVPGASAQSNESTQAIPAPNADAATAAAPAPAAVPNATPAVTTVTGTGTTNYIPQWTSTSTLGNSLLFQAGGKVGIGTTTPTQTLDVNGNSIFRGSFQLPPGHPATTTSGFESHSFQFQASAYNSTTKASTTQSFGFRTEPLGNNTANPSAKLELFFIPNGGSQFVYTGVSFAANGIMTFAPGQTFPGGGGGGGGTITGVTAGTGLTGGGTSGNVTLNVAAPLSLSSSNAELGVVSGTDNGSGIGVVGISATGVGVVATGMTNTGLVADGAMVGVNTMGGQYGLLSVAQNTSGTSDGVHTTGQNGVYAVSNQAGGNAVFAMTQGGGVNDYGVWGISETGYAGVFDGKVQVNGTLTQMAATFQIDHPLDPENKYLSHSFVESPDMMNIYNGIAEMDNSGGAIIQMPSYFSALNKEFRYQLTPIGAPGPNLYVAEEIQDNHFMIGGGKPGMRVSWQVTGVRQDAFANAHRSPVETDKPEIEKGTYLNPELFGKPVEKGREWAVHPDMMKRMPKRVESPR